MSEAPQGPTMICTTSVVNPGRTRIGHLGGNINLPRTVELLTIVAVVAGLLVGAVMALLVPVGGPQKFTIGVPLGGLAGWFAVTFSPMQNESLLKWLGLTVKTLSQQRYVEGRPVVLAVGVSIVDRQSAGRVRLTRGAVRIAPGSYDERGVARTAANRNLPQGALAVAGGFVTGAAATAASAGVPMPTDDMVAATPARGRRTTTAAPTDTPPAGQPSSPPPTPTLPPAAAQPPSPGSVPVHTPVAAEQLPAGPPADQAAGPRLRIRTSADKGPVVGRPRKLKD